MKANKMSLSNVQWGGGSWIGWEYKHKTNISHVL